MIDHTNQTEPFILVQPSSDSSSSQQQLATVFPLFPVAISILIAAIVLPFWSQRDKLFRSLNSSDSADFLREFAIDIEVLNIRTQDYLRANVKATLYVFIANDNKQNAQKFLFEGDHISAIAVEQAVKRRAESAIRGSASEKTLEDLHKKRAEVGQKVKELLGNCLIPLGLTFRDIVIGEIEESSSYTANNYFDAKAVQTRTAVIQPAIFEARKIELETEEKIREKELDSEKLIRERELNIGKDIRIRELATATDLEKEEIHHQHESLKSLRILETVEESRIEHELKLELHKNEKEKELQTKTEVSELVLRKEIETTELKIRQELESLRTKIEAEIQLDKILNDTQLIDKNKEFQLRQVKVCQEIEKEEVAATIEIIGEEQKRLQAEIERAEVEEALTTVVEKAKALRQQQKAEIAAASVENEAKIIERLAEADSKRYHSIPATDADRTAQLIRELAPKLIENLPELAEVIKALAPQPGILGESNIYTFSSGNGEDINKLMSSTSGILLLQSLLNGKVGNFLGKPFH